MRSCLKKESKPGVNKPKKSVTFVRIPGVATPSPPGTPSATASTSFALPPPRPPPAISTYQRLMGHLDERKSRAMVESVIAMAMFHDSRGPHKRKYYPTLPVGTYSQYRNPLSRSLASRIVQTEMSGRTSKARAIAVDLLDFITENIVSGSGHERPIRRAREATRNYGEASNRSSGSTVTAPPQNGLIDDDHDDTEEEEMTMPTNTRKKSKPKPRKKSK